MAAPDRPASPSSDPDDAHATRQPPVDEGEQKQGGADDGGQHGKKGEDESKGDTLPSGKFPQR